MAKQPPKPKCRWINLPEALKAFVLNATGHQGSEHIKPLHWYVACRLVLEGGFRPDEVSPRPPFELKRSGERWILEHDPSSAGGRERVVLGGLKTKNIDVVVAKDGIGPVIAVSMKGTLGAFRNLTNRMEEAVGDCTNLHISYPTLVYGFLHVLRGNRLSPEIPANDLAIVDGNVTEGISRYHDVMERLAGRDDVRDVTTKYEAVAMVLAETIPEKMGQVVASFPREESRLQLEDFFETLYTQYDQRFVYAAPALRKITRRLEWAVESPVVTEGVVTDYKLRLRS